MLNVLLFVLLGGLSIGLGMAWQYTADWYGVFRGPAAGQLKSLDEDEVDVMFAQQRPQYEDYFHRVEIGSRVANFHVFGARRRFQAGTIVYVLARLVQNHPPLNIEVLLVAPDGSEVARSAHRMQSSFSHLVVPFLLTDELPLGRYRIVLEAEGYEAARKSFELVESADSKKR